MVCFGLEPCEYCWPLGSGGGFDCTGGEPDGDEGWDFEFILRLEVEREGIDFVGVLSCCCCGCIGGGCVQSVGGFGEFGSMAPAYLESCQ